MIALLLALSAGAGVCDDLDGATDTGVSQVDPRPGDLGAGHRVCARDELGVAIAGSAVIDTVGFYGLLGGGLVVDGAWTATDRATLFGGVELIRYDTLISAFSDSALGPGHTWAGGAVRLADSDAVAVAADGRIVLPTAVALYRHVAPLALDAGIGAEAGGGWLRGHGRLGLLTSIGIGKGPAAPWLGGTLRLGGELRPGRAFALVIDADATLGYAGGSGLEAIALAPALRFGTRRMGYALGGWVPIVAPERQPLGAELRIARRFSGD